MLFQDCDHYSQCYLVYQCIVYHLKLLCQVYPHEMRRYGEVPPFVKINQPAAIEKLGTSSSVGKAPCSMAFPTNIYPIYPLRQDSSAYFAADRPVPWLQCAETGAVGRNPGAAAVVSWKFSAPRCRVAVTTSR